MKNRMDAGIRPAWLGRLLGVFNLNDSRWGRGEDKPADASKPEGAAPDNEPVKPDRKSVV